VSDASLDQAPTGQGRVFHYQRLVDAFAWVFVFCSAISLVEPSPFDILAPAMLGLWFLGGFSVHRSFLLFAGLMLAYTFAGFAALTPWWHETEDAVYQGLSAYLAVVSMFFAIFVANRTEQRCEVILLAFTAGAFVAAICGLLGYFHVAGLGELFTLNDRAKGPFKDPNVFGPYLIVGALYLTQNLMLRRTRHMISSMAVLAVIVAGVFTSFSRGSWGAAVLSMSLMTGFMYATSDDRRLKRNIVTGAVAAVGLIFALLVVMLSMESTREFFFLRANPTQDYDEGATGRFGNQARAIPMLLDQFWGFGPLRFRRIFGIEAHNSYVTAFANEGWIGGLLFILIVGVTIYVGFRVMRRPSPFQRQAQIFAPAVTAYFAQAFQIDVDHWRHLLVVLGVVWGLEAARQKWDTRRERSARSEDAGRLLPLPARGERE
jgi:hypothetical protein